MGNNSSSDDTTTRNPESPSCGESGSKGKASNMIVDLLNDANQYEEEDTPVGNTRVEDSQSSSAGDFSDAKSQKNNCHNPQLHRTNLTRQIL